MTTDTDALDVLRRFGEIGRPYVHSQVMADFDAALSSLAAELERVKEENSRLNSEHWKDAERTAMDQEIQRVKVERDKLRQCVGLLRPEEAKNFWFQFNNHPSLAEIEGEASDVSE